MSFASSDRKSLERIINVQKKIGQKGDGVFRLYKDHLEFGTIEARHKPILNVEMSTNLPEINNTISNLKNLSDLKDEKQKNTVSETKSEVSIDMEFTSKLITNYEVIEEFVEKLGIKVFTENKDKWKKFYIRKCREVFNYIICCDWDPISKELVRNTIRYYHLLESGTLNKSKGIYILIVHGKLIKCGGDISSEKEEELDEKYSGYSYVSIIEYFVEICKFSVNDDNRRKE
ncbi:6802_t:CDS:2 [Diversispora eburnea]|uniref:6802_t:CDS:1 n=1 Tax=Diversispora eburnea TaxID=1213867 RepID=A0A9N8ZJ22_9GLOM|nr:6802_t:CDS:2 [Diversispora eburnea]